MFPERKIFFEQKIMLTPKFFITKHIVARKFLCANYSLNTDQIRSNHEGILDFTRTLMLR